MPDLIFPHTHLIVRQDRSAIKGHRPAVLWFTGLSGSGKSTLANAVEMELNRVYKAHTYLMDGDNIRAGLNRGLGFSATDRQENIRRVGEVTRLFVDAGLIVLTAFISPTASERDAVRRIIPDDLFIEIFVDCPLEVCEARDTKGLYRKARLGEIAEFTGVSAPYEPPSNPELVLRTDQLSVGQCVQVVVDYLRGRSILPVCPDVEQSAQGCG